jgi:hypothetical protein
MARDLVPTSPTILTEKFGEYGDEDPLGRLPTR